jgi:hypothetical protein
VAPASTHFGFTGFGSSAVFVGSSFRHYASIAPIHELQPPVQV